MSRFNAAAIAEMARLYAAGQHLRQIGKTFKTSRETVRQRLMAAGITMRPRSANGRNTGGGRPISNAKSLLMQEIETDLPTFGAGATVDDLADWLGTPRRELSFAVAALFVRGKVRISLPEQAS